MLKSSLPLTVDSTVRLAPTFKMTRKHAEWLAVLDHHERRLNELVYFVNHVEGYADIQSENTLNK